MKLTDEQLTPDELAHRKQARELADAVQVSAFPRAYDKWADEAEEWLSNFGYWRGTNSATQQLAIHDCEPSTETGFCYHGMNGLAERVKVASEGIDLEARRAKTLALIEARGNR